MRRLHKMILAALLLGGCSAQQNAGVATAPDSALQARIDVNSAPMADLVEPTAVVREIVNGLRFTEGPVWISGAPGYLLFSDIPADKVYRWDEQNGLSIFLDPVLLPQLGAGGRGGSNGLVQHPDGRLVLCEHGNRRLAVMDLAGGERQTLADRAAGKRLNSPNDVVFHRSGAAFFTDPPYGLDGLENSADAEQGVNGIYRLDPDGTVTRLATQTRPNGIGLSPDQNTLYVANSAQAPHKYLKAYDVRPDLTLGEGRIFFDANALTAPGVPDGLVVAQSGDIFATGPGGVLVLSAQGEHLGTIVLPQLPANVTLGGRDGRDLYITARSSVYHLRSRVAALP